MTNVDSTEFLAQKRRLNKLGLWYCSLPVFFSMVLAAVIYVFQDSISPIFNSSELCMDRDFRSISFWVLPKITSHCDLLLNGILKDHPSADIAIFLDIFVALFFAIYLITMIVYCSISFKNYQAIVEERVKNLSSNKLALVYLAGISLVLYSTYFTFFASDLVSDETSGVSRAFAMFSSQFGIGAALHIVHASAGPFLLCALALILRTYNSLNATARSDGA